MNEYFKKFNFEYLYASCLVFDTNYKHRVIKCTKDHMSFFKRVKIFYYFFTIWFRRLFFHFRNNLVLISPKICSPKSEIVFKKNILEVAIINDKIIESKTL